MCMLLVLPPDLPNGKAKPPNVERAGPGERKGFSGPTGAWSSPGVGGKVAEKTNTVCLGSG